MLVVDINALQAVNLLHLGDDVVLYRKYAHYIKHICGIYGALGDLVALVYKSSLMHPYLVAVGHGIVFLRTCLGIREYNVSYLLYFLYAAGTCASCDNSRILGLSRFKQLLNTGKTLCDILCRGDTARVEGSHGKLCTGLTDGLCGDDADRLTHCHKVVVGKVCTVALCAHAVLGLAVEDGAYHNSLYARIYDLLRICGGEELVLGGNELVCSGISEVVHEVAAYKSFLKGLDHFGAVLDGVDLYANIGAAVLLTDDYLL